MKHISKALCILMFIAPFYTAAATPKSSPKSGICGTLAGTPHTHSPTVLSLLSEFNGMPTFNNPMESIESLITMVGKADPQLQHHKSYVSIARREGRVFENPDLKTLPAGVFPFVILEDNTIIFGLDDTGLEIGVKHFQLAQGRNVKVAGEFDSIRDQFNVESGSYMKKLRFMNGYSQDRAIQILARLFSEMRGTNVDYTTTILVKKPKSVTSQQLKKYCEQETFAKLHPVICGK